MENENIKLSRFLTIIVYKKLKEMGIDHKGVNFSKEELNLITSLDIETDAIFRANGGLQGIEYFQNLQQLTISSKQDIDRSTPLDTISISQEEMEKICKCSSLKKLFIHNQTFVEDIDVSKLENLEELYITNNRALETINGLDKLENLNVLNIYANYRLYDIEGLDNIILNNDIDALALDVRMFIDAIGFNKDTGEYNVDALKKIVELRDSAIWCEEINGRISPAKTFTRSIDREMMIKQEDSRCLLTLNTAQMLKLHNKACEILQENVIGKNSNNPRNIMDTIIGIENYLAQNVKYDYWGKDHHQKSSKGIQRDGFTNGSFNTLVYNTGVCEGYTHAMQYLLKLRGISSHNVPCYAPGIKDTKEFKEEMKKLQSSGNLMSGKLPMNHSIICIDGFREVYDDPTWNAGAYQMGDKNFPYMLKTKSEIMEDHFLSQNERDIEDRITPSNYLIRKSIDSNEVFRKTRTSDLKEVFGKIKTYRFNGELSVDKGEAYEL